MKKRSFMPAGIVFLSAIGLTFVASPLIDRLLAPWRSNKMGSPRSRGP